MHDWFGLEREMGYSRRKFFLQLPRTLEGYNYTITGDQVTVTLAAGLVVIELGEESARRLGDLVRFPNLPVSIRFDGVNEAEQVRFLRRFNSGYMKGLG